MTISATLPLGLNAGVMKTPLYKDVVMLSVMSVALSLFLLMPVVLTLIILLRLTITPMHGQAFGIVGVQLILTPLDTDAVKCGMIQISVLHIQSLITILRTLLTTMMSVGHYQILLMMNVALFTLMPVA